MSGEGSGTAPVSVIVPFFNSERFAEASLTSVLRQTTPPEELVVVDDASDTAGQRFLAEFQERWRSRATQVEVIRLPRRRGPGPARNLGVRRSTQSLIAFQDADDLWAPDKLERQVSLMQAWPTLDASHTDAVLFNQFGEEHRRPDAPRALTADEALRIAPMATPSIMIRREAFDRLGGFDERFRCSQDWDLQIRLALGDYQVQRVPHELIRVRRQDHGHHSGNWRCYLAGHLGVMWKHRAAYLERGGVPALLHQALVEFRMAGLKRGGWLGALFQVPARIVVGV